MWVLRELRPSHLDVGAILCLVGAQLLGLELLERQVLSGSGL